MVTPFDPVSRDQDEADGKQREAGGQQADQHQLALDRRILE